jgi:outer membrane protein insertion porin family
MFEGEGRQSDGTGRRIALTRSARALAAVLLALFVTGAAAGGTGAARAAVVAGASVTGHETLSTREILAILGMAEGEDFDRDRLSAAADSLLALYAGAGRPLAVVRAVWDSTAAGIGISVEIDEGPDVRVSRIDLDAGERPVPAEFVRDAGLRPGTVLTPSAVAGAVDAVLSGYADSGAPFAEVSLPGSVELSADGGLAAVIDIREGPGTWFGEVVVAGNTVTRDHVIARETGIERGAPYSESRLADVRPKLERLAFLRSVDEPVVAVDPSTGEATVGVAVEEGTSNRISGVLGLAGGSGGSDELTGVVDIELGNIAGTGRSASAAWQQIREGQTEISFSYTEPWLLGAPVDVGVAGSQSVRDTLYTTTEGDLLVTARVGDRTRVTWSVGGERYVPGAATESTTTSARTALAAEYDGTDAPRNPTSGLRLGGGIEYAAKEARDTGREERSGTLTTEAWAFLRVAGRQVVALRASFAGLSSTEDEVPFHELLPLGGARSLRGYREEQFRGTTVALASVEYRFLMGRRSRAIAFVDVGHWRREGPNRASDTNLGYGIGLRGDTRLGTISIDYGLGEGDDLLDGKLHAGLIREF